MTFVFDPYSLTVINQQIIASRDCLPATESKQPDTKNVCFSGDMTGRFGRFVTWYGGVSDTGAARLTGIPNPFDLKR